MALQDDVALAAIRARLLRTLKLHPGPPEGAPFMAEIVAEYLSLVTFYDPPGVATAIRRTNYFVVLVHAENGYRDVEHIEIPHGSGWRQLHQGQFYRFPLLIALCREMQSRSVKLRNPGDIIPVPAQCCEPPWLHA